MALADRLIELFVGVEQSIAQSGISWGRGGEENLQERGGLGVVTDELRWLAIAPQALNGGTNAQAAMVLFDDLDQPPVSRRRLADDHQRIATSARRTTIGAEEIRAMEARLAATRARRSIWLRTAPTWAGTAAVLLRGATEEHPGEREFAVYAAGILAVGGLVAILGDILHPFERYQRRLERLDLRLDVGPSGLGVRGAW